LQGDGNWTDLQAKGVQDSKRKNIYIVNYLFEKLEPAKYEAQLAAKNANGWSSMSRVYEFKINGNSKHKFYYASLKIYHQRF
jgi:hypothetical protein